MTSPTPSAEDYLENIYELIQAKGYARAVEIADADFLGQLRLLKYNMLAADGQKWERSAIFLNECYRIRERSLHDHLKSVLVLKRLLDLNPTLRLTLDDFHAGRDLVMPAETDLRERHHMVDWETARLFYETLDYYYAFESTVLSVAKSEALQDFSTP